MFTRATKASIIVAGLTITAALLVAGDGNSFQFDKKVYNLAREKQTQIIVKEDTGYKFSGKSKKISGNSAIKGTDVSLRVSKNKDDTQVAGFFTPTMLNEREMWVPSQTVTVIQHYIQSATYRHNRSKKRQFTMYYAVIIAEPDTIGEPKVDIHPAGLEPRPMKLRGGGKGRYKCDAETGGHRQGGTVSSAFYGDTTKGECVKVGK